MSRPRSAHFAMAKFYQISSSGYFITATIALMVLAFSLFVLAVWEIISVVARGGDAVREVLNSIGLIIIGFAVMETAKFIAEEEVLRKRELRSLAESRASLTKFVTIIVIAASLEALVMVFRATRENISESIFPAALLATSMLALVGLGLYQWLSSHVTRSASVRGSGDDDDNESS